MWHRARGTTDEGGSYKDCQGAGRSPCEVSVFLVHPSDLGAPNTNPPPMSCAGGIQLGTLPATATLKRLGLPIEEAGGSGGAPAAGPTTNPLAAILPLLMSDLATPQPRAGRVMVVKGLPALPAKVVEKAQALEFVEMEDFLPAPRTLRLAEQGKGSLSL